MPLILRLVLPLLLLGVGASPASAAQKVTGFRLDNGMEAVVIEDHRAPVVTHMVWYRVGSADEPWGKSGIAHFFEHLMFKATDELADGAFSKVVAANGGVDNAFTWYDYTAYYQRIAADRLELVMRMEADRMRDLVLTAETLETERAVILEERNQRTENNPQALFNEQLGAAFYLNHPYRRPPIGWRREVEQLDLADAKAFYDRYYAPDNAILVVAGDVTPDQVRALAEKHYGPIAPSGRPPAARPQEPPQRAARRVVMHDARVRQPYVIRFYLAPNYDPANPRESAAVELLGDLIGSGITSRLARKLQLEQKIAIDTGTFYSRLTRDQTQLAVYGVPGPGQKLEAIEAGIDAVLAELAASGPTADELERLRRRKRAAWIFAQDNVFGVARTYGSALATGSGIADVQNWIEVLESVTADEIRAAAEKYLVPEHSVTGLLMGTEENG